MSEQVSLAASERQSEGKSANRNLRRSGYIPGVLYGGKDEPKKISIMEKDIVKATEIAGFATQILRISMDGKDVDVVVKEIQRHPATSRVLHADFMRVDPDSKITLVVPIRTLNDESCIGVKVSGGQVNHLINDIEISCLASNLPEQLEIDVQEMDIGDTISLSEIKLPEGVEITILQQDEDRDQAVVSVTETREMIIEEEEEELELEEGEEGEREEGEEGEAEATEGTEEDSETPTEGKESDPSEEKQKE
jgi:large subunit ribosomal protein L25